MWRGEIHRPSRGGVFVVTSMAAGLFTIGCFGPLIAIYVRESLHASAGAFGLVSGTIGMGLLIGTQAIRQDRAAVHQRDARAIGPRGDWRCVRPRGAAVPGGDAVRRVRHRLRVRGDHGAGANAAAEGNAAGDARPGVEHDLVGRVSRPGPRAGGVRNARGAASASGTSSSCAPGFRSCSRRAGICSCGRENRRRRGESCQTKI